MIFQLAKRNNFLWPIILNYYANYHQYNRAFVGEKRKIFFRQINSFWRIIGNGNNRLGIFRDNVLYFLTSNTSMERHLTATTMVVCQNKTLLHLHKKLGIWLPVGGHIDEGELPEHAALREVREETGLDVELYNPDASIFFGNVTQCIRPMYILLEDVNEHRQDIDFIYYATAKDFALHPQERETKDMKWFLREELDETEMPNNVKMLAKEAIQLLGK